MTKMILTGVFCLVFPPEKDIFLIMSQNHTIKDIHCHLLYGVSDGPADLETGCAMLDQAAAAGVDYINAVAHYGDYGDRMAAAAESLQPEAAKRGISLHIGFEYDFSDILEDRIGQDIHALRTIGEGSNYILVDFNDSRIPFSARQRFAEIAHAGRNIVIVHPETLFGLGEINKLTELKSINAVVQINASNLLPDSNPRIRRAAFSFLRTGLVDLVASDAHRSTGSRRNALAEARKIVAEKFGEGVARVLFEINPVRILENKLPYDVEVPQRTLMEKLLRKD